MLAAATPILRILYSSETNRCGDAYLVNFILHASTRIFVRKQSESEILRSQTITALTVSYAALLLARARPTFEHFALNNPFTKE